MERVKERVKAIWRLVGGNLIYDLLKISAIYILPWTISIFVTGIVAFQAYINSQPPGFFAMLLVFGTAFFLTTIALRNKYQPADLQPSRLKLYAVAAAIFLGIPVTLLALSRIPFTQEKNTEIASPRQHDSQSPKVEEPNIEKLKLEDQPPVDKAPKQAATQSTAKNVKLNKPESMTDVQPVREETRRPVNKHTEQQRSEGLNSPNITTYGPNSPVTTGPNSPITINPEKGWQKLTDENLAKHASLLIPFAGQRVKFLIPNAIESQFELMRQLTDLLKRADWQIDRVETTLMIGGGPSYGVRIRANSVSRALEAIARATIGLLGKENVLAGTTPSDSPLDGDHIQIVIWPKAPPE